MKLNIVQTKEDENDITFNELSSAVNGAYENINIDMALDYIEFPLRLDFLKQAVDKLKFGGYISISVIDVTECNMALETGELNIEQYNELIFKNKYKSLNNILSIIDSLQNYGLIIESKTFSQPTTYYVKAKRPE